MRKIINIISGKGGTGKTLLTAVIAETLANKGKTVLVIDLDVFVRGLTALLYFRKNETIKITKDNEWSVSDFFKHKGCKEYSNNISICRYLSFDVCPSVTKVNDILNFKDIMPDSTEEANEILVAMLNCIPEKYEYIFFDNRAGFDELINATHQISDFSLCVEEDDAISKITSDNLIAQLREEWVNKPIFRIRNKARRAQKEHDFYGIEYIGSIPFDTDVLDSFGAPNFWDNIGKSLYKEYLIRSWNILVKKMDLDGCIEEKRMSPIGIQKIEDYISMFSSNNRIIFIYGIIITLLSFYLIFNESNFFEMILHDPRQLLGLFMSIFGILMITFSVFSNNRK